MTLQGRSSFIVASVCLLLLVTVSAGAWVWGRSDGAPVTSTTATTILAHSISPTSSKALSAPTASVAEDGQFLTEVTEVDPALASYERVGEGMMQWAPYHKHVVADWDYTVEND
jgi:hypothetical protein